MDTNGIGDAVRQLIELADKTKQTTILGATGEKRGTYYLVGPDGKGELKVAGPDWHGETLGTPGELKKFITDRQQKDGSVFLGEDKIVFVYNLNDRRDVAVCPLKLSPQYQWLTTGTDKLMTQADFVRLLRITFRGCLTSENLLPLVRQIKFDSSESGHSDITQGRQSMGRQITAQVLGLDAIPEDTALIVPIFENHSYSTKVACAIEVDPGTRTFKLTPYPLEIKAAMDAAMMDLEGLFEGEDAPPVYRGKP